MKILVSGLLNVETTCAVRGFPINYYPIDYPFFGVNSAPAGVALNLAMALKALGDEVILASMLGNDFSAEYIRSSLNKADISTDHVKEKLDTTPSSVILYDPDGKRQIYCDLKDIQEKEYGFDPSVLDGVDLVAACNINFNRSLLKLAKEQGKIIATDVHALSDPLDSYNREFLEYADIVFLSDEYIGDNYREFMITLAETYHNEIIVMGRGSKGASIYIAKLGTITDIPAYTKVRVVNTVGAGDALFSSFIHYYLTGLEPEEALWRAEIFAAIKIQTNGASRGFVSEDEIERIVTK